MYVAAVDAVVFLLLLLFLPVIVVVCICYHYSLSCCFSVVVAGIDVIAVGAVLCGFPNTIP